MDKTQLFKFVVGTFDLNTTTGWSKLVERVAAFMLVWFGLLWPAMEELS